MLVVVLAHVVDAAPSEHTEEELVGVITMQPRAPHAPQYALALLGRLKREQRMAEHTAWVDRMLSMPRLLAGREELILALQNIQIAQRFLDARLSMAHATRSRLPEDWRRAARAFVDTADVSRRWSESPDVRTGHRVVSITDDATYYAGWCWEQAGEVLEALASYGAVPRGDLRAGAAQRIVTLGVRSVVRLHVDGAAWLAR